MKVSKVRPVTWFTLGIIVADSIATIMVVEAQWGYEAALLRFIHLPLWQILILKVVGSTVGLFVIEWLRQKYEYVRETAHICLSVLLIVYSTAMLLAWTAWIIQYVKEV
jgi:hypothetical protein